MSSIVTFFIAADDAAASSVAPTDPEGDETVQLGNFDPIGMLNDWEAAFLARDADEIAEGGRPEVGGGARDVRVDGASVLIAVSPDLVTDLAEADAARLEEVRARWIQLESLDGEDLDAVTATELLTDIAALAALATERGEGVYCWWY